MTVIYDHRCQDCGPVIVETDTISEYLDFKEEYGLAEGGNVQVPCPSCGKMAPRDYQAGTAPFKVKGGTKYKSVAYSNEVKKNWYQEEIKNTKEVLRFKSGVNPYSNMQVRDPEGMGFQRVSGATAIKKAEASRRTLGDVQANADREISKL